MDIMTGDIPAFDLTGSDLAGSHLLEASAGTGKTYSLSFIYLRLILEKHYRVEEIVVATFTNAATAELKERIYARLVEAEKCLANMMEHNTQTVGEAHLIALLQTLRKDFSDEVLSKRLRLAQVQFDRAQIYSLDGFATHLLQTHGITLGHSAPEIIETDDIEIIKALYLELAHENFTALGEWASLLGEAVKSFSSEKLFPLLNQMLTHHDALVKTAEQLTVDKQVVTQFEETVERLFSQRDDFPMVAEIINDACRHTYLAATSYTRDKVLAQCQQLEQRQAYRPENAKWFEFFSRTKLCKSLKKDYKDKTHLFEHGIFADFDELVRLAPLVKDVDNNQQFLALMQLTTQLKERLKQHKAEQMVMTHRDIMQVVSNGADKLVEVTDYQAVLLDEAQDTNSEQLALFQKLFLDCGRICFFVGDPKQAIYGFRGGNVYTYLDIREQVTHHYRLPNNFRSSKTFNESINALFSHNPFTQGIDYHNVGGGHTNSSATLEATALTLLTSDSKESADLADIAAESVVRLLNEQQTIDDKKNQTTRILQSQDIAVLVRGHKQAEMIKSALSKRGLSASYLGKNSVYDSDEALLLHRLLLAMSTGNTRDVRSLMLSALFNYPADTVLDENRVNQLRSELRKFAADYSTRRFATLFYHVMQRYQIPGQLLCQDDGKRRLSNIIQLFELLQHALQRQSLSLQGLCDFLMRQIQSHDKETELRLEDEHAVSIMTIHQSKGLEFPVVCLPFINYRGRVTHQAEQLSYSHQRDQAMLGNLNCPDLKQACQDEADAEEIRLAYVALTRAIYRNIVVLQPQPKNSNASRSNSSWHKITESLNPPISEQPFSQTSHYAESEITHYTAPPEQAYCVKTLPASLAPLWVMTSFSGLQQSHEAPQYPPLEKGKNNHNTHNEPLTVIPEPSILLRFVAGAKAGTLLHSLYEHYMQYRLLDDVFINEVQKSLDNHYPKRFSTIEVTELAEAIAETAKIPLYPKTFCLNDISRQQQGIEMQFFLHLSPAARTHLYHLFGKFSVENSLTEGYIHGFIDYWFCHDGQYYVLDYKSNKLGDNLSDYHPEAMQQAMYEHDYELQALIYTLALCKHLNIDSATDYETRIGGYFYLFIRGMNQQPTQKQHGIFHRKIDWQQLVPLLEHSGGN